MFVKVDSVTKDCIKVTVLDIDDYGAVVPVDRIELCADDDLILETLRNSSHAAIFTREDGKTIVLASGISTTELHREKTKTMNAVQTKREESHRE
jgi:phosphotransferase system IIA component